MCIDQCYVWWWSMFSFIPLLWIMKNIFYYLMDSLINRSMKEDVKDLKSRRNELLFFIEILHFDYYCQKLQILLTLENIWNSIRVIFIAEELKNGNQNELIFCKSREKLKIIKKYQTQIKRRKMFQKSWKYWKCYFNSF